MAKSALEKELEKQSENSEILKVINMGGSMKYSINSIEIDNFKSYSVAQEIMTSDLSVFLGANSSGKSTALQTILALKQTVECNSKDVDLLLSGKYVALGDYNDVIHDRSRDGFDFGASFILDKENKEDSIKSYKIVWHFKEAEDRFQAKLDSVEIDYQNTCIRFTRTLQDKYQMIIDSEKTPVYISFRNLKMSASVHLKYDSKFNSVFADFINEILSVHEVEGNRVSSEGLVSYKIESDFYFKLLSDDVILNQKEELNEKTDDEIEKAADSMIELIDKFCLFQNPMGDRVFEFERDMKKSCLISMIKKSEDTSLFFEIIKKYSKIYEDYSTKKINVIYDNEHKFHRVMFGLEKDKHSKILDEYKRVSSFYDGFERFISNVFFLGPIRENPKGLYNIGFEQNPKYVGPTGSNFASVLLHENKVKNYFLPYDEEEKISLWEALNEWAAHLNVASAIKVSQATSFGIRVSVSDTQNKTADIMNVGIGTSQILPVLITGLLSEKGETLIFEQPELHLHPYSQSRLADFFVELINRGRQIIVETHSEAFILRLRYHILKKNCNKDSVSIVFFQNNQGTKVSLCNVSGYGIIQYPDDFKDETQELLNDLMNAALKKET